MAGGPGAYVFGAYVTATGEVKKIDPVFHAVTMADGTVIDMEDIVGVNQWL